MFLSVREEASSWLSYTADEQVLPQHQRVPGGLAFQIIFHQQLWLCADSVRDPLISSSHRGSGAYLVVGARAPVIAPEAQEVEEGSQQVADQYLEGEHGLAACVVAVAEDSCCSLEVDMLVASWVAGRWKEEGDLEEVLWEGDTHDTVALGWHKWVAWEHRWGLLSSSWTAGSENLHPTCRSWWWT